MQVATTIASIGIAAITRKKIQNPIGVNIPCKTSTAPIRFLICSIG